MPEEPSPYLTGLTYLRRSADIISRDRALMRPAKISITPRHYNSTNTVQFASTGADLANIDQLIVRKFCDWVKLIPSSMAVRFAPHCERGFFCVEVSPFAPLALPRCP